MGFLSYFKNLTSKNLMNSEPRILFLGLDNSGKTTILRKLCNEDLDTVTPTQGFNIKTLQSNNSKFIVWDVGGQKSLRPYWRNYFEGTDAIVFVIDSSDSRRLGEAGIALFSLLEDDSVAKLPIAIIANKQDLLNALTINEIISSLNLTTLTSTSWQLFPTSAKTGEGIDEIFHYLYEEISSMRSLTRKNRTTSNNNNNSNNNNITTNKNNKNNLSKNNSSNVLVSKDNN